MTDKLNTSFFFFFNDTATTEIYTLSLHDALPILRNRGDRAEQTPDDEIAEQKHSGRHERTFLLAPLSIHCGEGENHRRGGGDRKSTRLNSSHLVISYAVFCLKKKKKMHIAFTHGL